MRERAGNQALLAAGLGLLASRSPFPGVALGQAGLGALRAYEGAQDRADTIDEREQEAIDRGLYQRANLDMHAKRFADQARETAQRIKIEGDRAANTAKHEADTLAETSRYHNIEAKNQADRLQIERDREAREAGQGQWEPQAPVIDPVTKQPKTDPTTGAPLWQWFDKKNNKTMQGPYQPVPAKESGDVNARLVADTNAQFSHLMQERTEMDKNPEARPKGWQRPTNEQLWQEAQKRVRDSYGLGRPGTTPALDPTNPLGLPAQPPAPGS